MRYTVDVQSDGEKRDFFVVARIYSGRNKVMVTQLFNCM